MNTTYVNDLFLVKKDHAIQVAYPPLESALGNWADATTDQTSDRRDDLRHDKRKAVSDFFQWICKPVHEITPNDVKSGQIELERRNLAPAKESCKDVPTFLFI
jgi:hypothetical protein